MESENEWDRGNLKTPRILLCLFNILKIIEFKSCEYHVEGSNEIWVRY